MVQSVPSQRNAGRAEVGMPPHGASSRVVPPIPLGGTTRLFSPHDAAQASPYGHRR